MQSRGLEILVGFFVCLGIAAIFILTMRVSNLANAAPPSGYTVTAAFSNIGGLKSGAPVEMAGVRIGRVTGIKIDQQTYQAVVSMKLGSQYKLPKDSDASILTQGLLGEQYIGMGPGASEKYLKNGDKVQITQSAIVLENVIGQVLYSLTSSDKNGPGGGGSGGSDSLPSPGPGPGAAAGSSAGPGSGGGSAAPDGKSSSDNGGKNAGSGGKSPSGKGGKNAKPGSGAANGSHDKGSNAANSGKSRSGGAAAGTKAGGAGAAGS